MLKRSLWRIETHISLCRLKEILESSVYSQRGEPVAPVGGLEKAFHEIRVLTEVTGRKHAEERVRQAERELKRSEAFLAQGQRLGSTGTFSWKVATDEVTWSEELYRIYDFEIGVPVTLDMAGTPRPSRRRQFDRQDQDGRSGRSRDNNFEWHWRLLMPDGSLKYLHAVAGATQDGVVGWSTSAPFRT